MTRMTLSDAKARFSEVADRVASGEEVVVTRMGRPILRLSPFREPKGEQRLGWLKGQGSVPDDFKEWPDEEARAFGVID